MSSVTEKIVLFLSNRYRYNDCCFGEKSWPIITEENILSEKRRSSIKSFDMKACSEASLEDLDLSAIKNLYLPKAIAEDILADDDRSLKEQLVSLRLYDREKDCPTVSVHFSALPCET